MCHEFEEKKKVCGNFKKGIMYPFFFFLVQSWCRARDRQTRPFSLGKHRLQHAVVQLRTFRVLVPLRNGVEWASRQVYARHWQVSCFIERMNCFSWFKYIWICPSLVRIPYDKKLVLSFLSIFRGKSIFSSTLMLLGITPPHMRPYQAPANEDGDETENSASPSFPQLDYFRWLLGCALALSFMHF